MADLETLNLENVIRLAQWCIRADRPLHMIGEPGIGKSAIASVIADSARVALAPLILSQSAPEDVGGIPVPGAGQVARLPIGPIKRCVDAPGLLFLDEVSTAPIHAQASALTLINERFAGDVRLHVGTRILLASNPPKSSAGGMELAPPFVNRIHSVNVAPELAEVAGYLSDLGGARAPVAPVAPLSASYADTLRGLGADYAITMEKSPNLLQVDAPTGARASEPWASPRAIERALRIWASAIDAGERADDLQVAKWCLAGSIGGNAASVYLAILRVRDRIASPAEILKDPRKAKIPTDTDTGIASLGVVARVAEMDVACAWIYMARLSPEFRMALAPRLLGKAIDPKSPWAKDGSAERIKALGAHGATIARASKGGTK
jgi:MoxR-like ATPase